MATTKSGAKVISKTTPRRDTHVARITYHRTSKGAWGFTKKVEELAS